MKDIEFWSEQKTPDEVMDTVGGAFGNAAMIIKSAALDAGIPIDNGLLQELFDHANKAAAIAFRMAENIRREEVNHGLSGAGQTTKTRPAG